jgi:TAP-like protein
LAQIVMRDYRRAIRSVDLEAVIDPRQNWVALSPTAFDRSRLELFKACAADAACNAAYPNLPATFDALIAELNTTQPEIDIPVSPTETIRARVNGDLFFALFNQLLYVSSVLPALPFFVTLTKAGNYTPFGNLLGLLFVSDGTNSQGMYQSVVCSDVAQFTTENRINRILDRVTQTYRRQLGVFPLSQARICREWGVKPDLFATFPVISDIPTLLQVGFFDPITPPSYAAAVEKRLFNSQTVFYPAGAHGATQASGATGDEGDCAQGILTAFWNDPRAAVNAGCAAAPIRFLVPNASTASAQSLTPFPLPKSLPAPLLPRW